MQGATDRLKEFLNIMEPDLVTVVSKCQAYLHYRFWAGVSFLTAFQPTKIGLIQMSILTYLVTGYASILQKCRKDLREVICIKRHSQISSPQKLMTSRASEAVRILLIHFPPLLAYRYYLPYTQDSPSNPSRLKG